jgi:hypothetical protein
MNDYDLAGAIFLKQLFHRQSRQPPRDQQESRRGANCLAGSKN